ncbi:Hypothetical predicted protein [Paramuricea clavata]|uniref:Uncharacterized protein n=1 Tax=Paramuricea clavata TaxID=317549 RepID=A0A6S7GS53_PARCT|nr:Hypothetical predicted protein [Paramuricea clavata]
MGIRYIRWCSGFSSISGGRLGEVIGVKYLRLQTGDCPDAVQDLDRDIDEAFGEFEMKSGEEEGDSRTDETVAHPEDSSDSGNEEDEEAAMDASGIPGWDKVGKRANALLALDSHFTNKQAGEIKQLYLNLDEYDKKPLVFSPRYKKAKGRFLKKKKTGHVGTEAMARTFVTGGQVARCPSKSRLVEAIMIRFTGEAVEQRAKGPGSPYLSKWKVVLLRYNALRKLSSTVASTTIQISNSIQLMRQQFPNGTRTRQEWMRSTCSYKTYRFQIHLSLQMSPYQNHQNYNQI